MKRITVNLLLPDAVYCRVVADADEKTAGNIQFGDIMQLKLEELFGALDTDSFTVKVSSAPESEKVSYSGISRKTADLAAMAKSDASALGASMDNLYFALCGENALSAVLILATLEKFKLIAREVGLIAQLVDEAARNGNESENQRERKQS